MTLSEGSGRAQPANSFSEQLPYTTWREAEAVFYLEGHEPGSIDGIGFALELSPQTGATEQMAAIPTANLVALSASAAIRALDTEAIAQVLKRQIANFKVPKQVFVVTELPRNTMGKVQKNLLRAAHQDLFKA